MMDLTNDNLVFTNRVATGLSANITSINLKTLGTLNYYSLYGNINCDTDGVSFTNIFQFTIPTNFIVSPILFFTYSIQDPSLINRFSEIILLGKANNELWIQTTQAIALAINLQLSFIAILQKS
jgi:hypothetical protein